MKTLIILHLNLYNFVEFGEVIGPDNKHNNDFFGADYTDYLLQQIIPYNPHQKSHYCVFSVCLSPQHTETYFPQTLRKSKIIARKTNFKLYSVSQHICHYNTVGPTLFK